MTAFAYPDHVVQVNIIEAPPSFDLSYIQRVLFVVRDADLPVGTVNYLLDVESITTLPTAGDYIKQYYFYKEDVKTCDILFIASDILDLDAVLTTVQKGNINDRTYTISLDIRAGIPSDLTYTFFKGVTQWSSNVFLDADNLARQTVVLNKTDTVDIANENKEMARFASWFVNRTNFFTPPGNKELDYIYNDNGYFDILTEEDLNLARQNNMTYFAAYADASWLSGYNVGSYFNIVPYYEEQIRRAVQEALFDFITDTTGVFFTATNVNIAYTTAINAVLVYSKPPYSFVDNDSNTFVKRTKFSDIPQADKDDGLLRIDLSVSINQVIRRIIVNIETTVGNGNSQQLAERGK